LERTFFKQVTTIGGNDEDDDNKNDDNEGGAWMGLVKGNLHLLAMERRVFPIHGDTLVLSQQAVYATVDDIVNICKRHKVAPQKLPMGFDTANKIPSWKGKRMDRYTNCQALMRMLGAKRVFTCDISDYEGADLIIDLSKPVDPKYHGTFDTIVDMGTLEHIFDLPQALDNVYAMLRPGGTVILGTMANNSVNHGFYSISPTLLNDYFAARGFTANRVYLRESSPILYDTPCRIFRLEGRGITQELPSFSRKVTEVWYFGKKPLDGRGKRRADGDAGTGPSGSVIQSSYLEMGGWEASSSGNKVDKRKSSKKMKKGGIDSENAGNPSSMEKDGLLVRFFRVARSSASWMPTCMSDTAERLYWWSVYRRMRSRKEIIYVGKF